MKKIKVIVFLFFVLCSKNLLATAQIGDILVVNEDTVWIHSNPLECYFATKGDNIRTIGGLELGKYKDENGNEYFVSCSALWRGYIATWKLENDSLFLIGANTGCAGKDFRGEDIDISLEFGSNKVFAWWFTGTICRPDGELIWYFHGGYESIYEREIHYVFVQGKLIDIEEINNVTTSIVETKSASNEIAGYYNIMGIKLSEEPKSGLYIILYSNGQTEKKIKKE